MPVKLKDFLRKGADTAQIKDTDFEAVLSASGLAELEVTDEFVSKWNNAYLTRERAENDAEIVKKIKLSSKSEVLDGIDDKIGLLLSKVPKDKSEEIEKEKNTFKKLELVNEALEAVINNTKSGKEQDLRKVEEEWSAKLKNQEAAWKTEKDSLVQKMKDDQLHFVLKNKILSYNFADHFTDVKPALTEAIINQIKSHTHNGTSIKLILDEAGNVNVRQEIEGSLRDVYTNGNDKLTIDNLIDPAVDKFLKKSSGEPPKPGDQKQPVSRPFDQSKATLTELRAAAALAG